MSEDNKEINLSSAEIKVLNILWKQSKPMIASDIADVCGFSKTTAHNVINSLYDYGMIRITELIKSGKSYSRAFEPSKSQMEYFVDEIIEKCLELNLSEKELICEILRKKGIDEDLVKDVSYIIA